MRRLLTAGFALLIVACSSRRVPSPEEQAQLAACAPKQAVTLKSGVQLDYETFGPETGQPLLLIMGLGAQRVVWDPGFIDQLVAKGFRVITFDNRDVGLSSKFPEQEAPGLRRLVLMRMLGMTPEVPYTLGDMAADAVGLLDALGIEKAHVLGMSMGGMIAQELAVRFPQRVLSLTSIMSTTNDPSLPRPDANGLKALSLPPAKTREEAIANGVKTFQLLGGSKYPQEEAFLRARAVRSIDRCGYREGVARQLAAVLVTPSRREALSKLAVPTLVIHGTEDPLVPFAGGEDTAKHIPGAKFLPIEGMGHDIPPQLWTKITDEIAAVAGVTATGVTLRPGLTVRPLGVDLWLSTHEEAHDSNVLIARFEDGTVLFASSPFDTVSTRALVEWARAQLSPSRMVAINTHWHLDGSGGNEAYRAAGVETWASTRTEALVRERGERLREAAAKGLPEELAQRVRATAITPAEKTFREEDGLRLTFGGEEVSVNYPGAAHSQDNVVVFLPRRGVLFGGCMVKVGDSLGYLGDASVETWEEALRKVAALRPQRVVPGHGPVGGAELLENTIRLVGAAKAGDGATGSRSR